MRSWISASGSLPKMSVDCFIFAISDAGQLNATSRCGALEAALDETWKEAVDDSGSTVSGAERTELYAALGPPSPPPNSPQSPPFPGWSVEKEKELRNAEFRENKKEKIFLNNMRLATKKENAKKAKREALDRSFHTKWDKRTVTVEDLF